LRDVNHLFFHVIIVIFFFGKKNDFLPLLSVIIKWIGLFGSKGEYHEYW